MNSQSLHSGVAQKWATSTPGAVGLPWVGGKKGKCSEYITRFPNDKPVLIDVFTGGGSIGFTASQKFKEVVMNDIDYNIISLYQYLASDEDLIKILDFEYTEENFKYAHQLIKNSYNCIEFEDRAKYMIADVFQSFNNGRRNFQKPEYNKNYKGNVCKCISKIRNTIYKGNIQFKNESAFDILAEGYQRQDVFWFVDPPYENKLITNIVYYKKMLKDWEQELLAYLLSICKGKFMLCGYRGGDGSIYDGMLSKGSFHCYKLMDTYAFCGRNEKNKPKQPRIEYIWTNYPIDDLEEVSMSKAA